MRLGDSVIKWFNLLTSYVKKQHIIIHKYWQMLSNLVTKTGQLPELVNRYSGIYATISALD